MPFTLFHLGPGFFFGTLLNKWVNLPAILVGSIIVDVRAAYCLFTGVCPLHGPLHTFLGATILSLIVAVGIYSSRDWLENASGLFKIRQNYSTKSIIIGAVLGTWTHVLLDAFLYSDIAPFWPKFGNPLVGVIGIGAIYGFCVIGFVIGGAIYFLTDVRK